ncbi:hypothetical protein MLGJGCBP_01280 [Rhodococcus sp. T7]|uniref:Uncharacterized protein n=1 Tax=Rhodococcus opacus (strain B4) TaxID=632772 RepID=C1BDB1_RHOOB|nr:hypothetical protein MLGJGCBP_01280 [Rhodococcus sp. T7]BAH55855.1 hypothetical protein ROP_pROB01-03560 [Rhodococcus opacus B4]
MSPRDDDYAIRDGENRVPPPPDSVIERVTPVLRAALLLRAEPDCKTDAHRRVRPSNCRTQPSRP